ncbi:MAG: NfeD family protein [Ruminococcus sp.]|nr:NfeD family protein [Ruminococcus sp.]
MTDYLPFIWIGIAVVLAIIEGITIQLVSIWFMLGAIFAAITSVFTDSIIIQVLVFIIVSFVSLIATRPIVKNFMKQKGTVNTNSNRLVGQTGVMISDIADIEQIGRAKVSGEVWSVKTNSAPILKDSKIKVLAIEGVKLIIEPLQNKE